MPKALSMHATHQKKVDKLNKVHKHVSIFS